MLEQPENAVVTILDQIPCDGEEHIGRLQVMTAVDIPLEPIGFTLINRRQTCSFAVELGVEQIGKIFWPNRNGGPPIEFQTVVCVNQDDDDGNGTEDRFEAPFVEGENNLIPFWLLGPPPHVNTDAGVFKVSLGGQSNRLRFFKGLDAMPVVLPIDSSVDGPPFGSYWVEGFSSSDTEGDLVLTLQYEDDIRICRDVMKITSFDAGLETITSGVNPLPVNPAIISPVFIPLADGTNFTDGNRFELIRPFPELRLADYPFEWTLSMTSGQIDPQHMLDQSPDLKSVNVRFPFLSAGNAGEANVSIEIAGTECAPARTLVGNTIIVPLRVHLCWVANGATTVRTAAQIRALIDDVNILLSQTGIQVSIDSVVSTQVWAELMDLDTTITLNLNMWLLFGAVHDPDAVDIYFINSIDPGPGGGATAGITGNPSMSGPIFNSGIVIADSTADGPLIGQPAVRTIAHELVHFLLNNSPANNDHVGEIRNLMFPVTDAEKRDLTEEQAAEMRRDMDVE